jgi:hypothetical protein
MNGASKLAVLNIANAAELEKVISDWGTHKKLEDTLTAGCWFKGELDVLAQSRVLLGEKSGT